MNIIKSLLAFFGLIIFVPCNQANGKIQNNSPVILKENQKEIDTSEYENLPYWDSTKRRYGDAYVDTFSTGRNRFRFISPTDTHMTGGNEVFLQQFINGKWTDTKIILEDNIHGGDFGYDADVNGDGFNDIFNTTRFTADVYFFNPSADTFIDTPLTGFSLDFYELDSSKKIFCEFQEFKRMCRQISTTLYTFKGFNKYSLYKMELYNCGEQLDEHNFITKFILSKCVNGREDSLITVDTKILVHPIDIDGYDDHGKYANGTDEYFDYKAYWRNKYKRLL